ncbi:MAG: hypothetical protein KDJ19_13780 [Hyphomicrobiaceae bacterium]|nr:hypothetical protein [Hyphomicrobiaceae bacterium]MCC0025102.1 hypothetical protein [Hyphomicrobiaceae bacterium]
MSTLPALLTNEVRLQQRYGIYIAYGVVVLFYVVTLMYLAPFFPVWLPALIIYTDPAAVGFFFLGALMMLEKGQATRMALGVTPVSAFDYFSAKAISLAAISIVAVTILSFLIPAGVNHVLLLTIALISSVQFIALGVPTALYFKTVTSYLMGAAGILAPFVIPAGLAFLDQMPVWAMLWPPAADLRLIMVATGAATNTGFEIAIMFAASLAGTTLAVWYATKRLEEEFGRS